MTTEIEKAQTPNMGLMQVGFDKLILSQLQSWALVSALQTLLGFSS